MKNAFELLATFKEWSSKLIFGSFEEKPRRAKTSTGRFIADDKSTKDINEAWVKGKAPKKKKRKK